MPLRSTCLLLATPNARPFPSSFLSLLAVSPSCSLSAALPPRPSLEREFSPLRRSAASSLSASFAHPLTQHPLPSRLDAGHGADADCDLGLGVPLDQSLSGSSRVKSLLMCSLDCGHREWDAPPAAAILALRVATSLAGRCHYTPAERSARAREERRALESRWRACGTHRVLYPWLAGACTQWRRASSREVVSGAWVFEGSFPAVISR